MELALVNKAIETAKKVCGLNRDCFGLFKLDTYCCTFQCCNLFEYVNNKGNPFSDDQRNLSPSILPYMALLVIMGVLLVLVCCCICCRMCCCRKSKQYVIFRNHG